MQKGNVLRGGGKVVDEIGKVAVRQEQDGKEHTGREILDLGRRQENPGGGRGQRQHDEQRRKDPPGAPGVKMAETECPAFKVTQDNARDQEARDDKEDIDPGETAWQLEVRAPAWLDGSAMIYRLAYADAAQWREFSQARWVAPPAGLLERRLQRLLGYGAAGKRDGCLLRLELDEFSQVFTAPHRSHALLQVRARWFDAGRKPLQVKTLRIEQPVPEDRAADAQSGVAALVEAVGMLAEQIAAQEKTLPAVCR